MIRRQPHQDLQSSQPLYQASVDFFFLQNHGYPRRSALEWVGNRHRLGSLERQLLQRGVFSQRDALQRIARRGLGASWSNETLVVDGHNVQITVESSILGRPILKANDGAIRDLAGQSANFRLTEASRLAVDLIFRFLRQFRPAGALFFFDAPISQSGILAQFYRREMEALGLPGTSRAVPVPEREFLYEEAIVASSDSAVLEKASRWVDLAGLVLSFDRSLQLKVDFSSIRLTRVACQDSPIPPWFS